MDRLRRQLLVGLALVPGLARPRLGRAGEAEPGAIVLEARAAAAAGGAGPPGLSYGDPAEIPVFRIRPGVATSLRLVNRLTEPTSLTFHGLRLPNRLDGVVGLTGPAIAAGATSDIAFTPPDSGSAWLHPGALPGVPDQTARGLVGVLIVEEASPPAVDADRVLVLTDRPAPSPAQAASEGKPGGGGLSQALWINRASWPETLSLPPRSRLRLRIVNASTQFALTAAFAGGRPYVVAIDGQPSELFEPLADTIPIGPGARFDLMLDLPAEPGLEVRLRLREAETKSVGSLALVLRSSASAPAAEKPPIAPLAPNPALPPAIPLEASKRVTLKVALGGPGPQGLWRINGVASDSLGKKPLFSVKRNSPVTLGFANASPQLTAFRLHGHVMRLLHALDDGWEPYWRDSVIVPPGVTHHVAFLADNPGRWLIESPFADQAAHGLRGWFEVIE